MRDVFDLEKALADAVRTDHPCSDLAGCDIARSLHEDFVYVAVHLLMGSTETPTVSAVLAAYPHQDTLASLLRPWPNGWDEWKVWHDEHKVVCVECEHRNYDAWGGTCTNCAKPLPDKPCSHSWVSGMMAVHEEDLASVAASRAASGSSLPECEQCELVYDLLNPPAMSYE